MFFFVSILDWGIASVIFKSACLCSSILLLKGLDVSPIYDLLQIAHLIEQTTAFRVGFLFLSIYLSIYAYLYIYIYHH